MLRPALAVAARAHRGRPARDVTRRREYHAAGLAPATARCYKRTDTIQRIKGNLLYITGLIIL